MAFIIGTSGNDSLLGTANADTIFGYDPDASSTNDGNDTINGFGGNDTIYGGSGNDSLIGSTGNDSLFGEGGNDTLIGGAGIDRMFGGTGADTFQFLSITDSNTGIGNRDVIADFTSGIDKIDLSAIDANLDVNGNQAFVFIGDGAFFGNGVGQVRFTQVFDGNPRTVISIDREGDNNLEADMHIALSGIVDLVASDFIL